MSSQVSGVSSASAGRNGWAVPESTATTDAVEPPPSCSITSRSGVPSSNSPTPARSVRPLTVHTMVPGDSGGAHATGRPRDRRGRWPGTLASVSTLFTSVAVGGLHAVAVRRRHPRERRVAVEHLEQRGLLAEQVAVGAGDAAQLDAVGPAAVRRSSSMAVCTRLATAVAERFMPDDHPVGADGVGRDERALEHLVRVAAQQRAVLERAGLALGAVDDDGRRLAAAQPGDGAPLGAGREPGAAPPAQPRGLDHLDEGRRLDGPGGLERPPAAARLVRPPGC